MQHGRAAPELINLIHPQVTLLQMQPIYRCAPGSPILARFGNDTDGCPQNFPNVTSILGDGALGAHGGSGLSGVGGTIRLGELLSNSPPIRHALKLEMSGTYHYFGAYPLQNATAYNGGRVQYVWPATGSDSGSTFPNPYYKGANPHLAPGALLALPQAVLADVHVTTPPGRKIRDALATFGGYIVDDTGGGNSVAICQSAEVNLEMRQTYGFAMTYPHGVARGDPGMAGALYEDLLSIFQNLHAVTNNAPGSIGGGGKPLAPSAPEICP